MCTIKAHTKVPLLPVRHYASMGTGYGPVSICLSVRHKSVFYQKEWTINLVFGMWASFDQSYNVF